MRILRILPKNEKLYFIIKMEIPEMKNTKIKISNSVDGLTAEQKQLKREFMNWLEIDQEKIIQNKVQ